MKKVLLLLCMAVSMPSGAGLLADPAAASPSLVEQAEAARREADALGFEWRDTAKLIKQAREALDKGQKEESDKLASLALLQGKAAVAQARSTEKNWKMMIPK